GASAHEQVVQAVERAVVAGLLRPGDRFPSVRALSKALQINPNTAHKIVASLVDAGILVVRPGIGTLVADDPVSHDPMARDELLGARVERLVVEAKRLGLDLDTVRDAVERHWRALSGTHPPGASDDA
ncbi:MAG: GntR family transcriptional regulator, partial [Acidobacteriota bacterium]